MFTMQMTIPGTARPITAFIMSLKPNLPEVNKNNPVVSNKKQL